MCQEEESNLRPRAYEASVFTSGSGRCRMIFRLYFAYLFLKFLVFLRAWALLRAFCSDRRLAISVPRCAAWESLASSAMYSLIALGGFIVILRPSVHDPLAHLLGDP